MVDHKEFTKWMVDQEITHAEFKMATYEAVLNNNLTFLFYGYTIEVEDAMDTVNYMEEGRVYH